MKRSRHGWPERRPGRGSPCDRDRGRQRAGDGAPAWNRASRSEARKRFYSPASFSARPTVKLLDFGLAKIAPVPCTGALAAMTETATPPITAAGTILGTFQYMAPEQIEGGEADARTDIFAFGSLLYEVVSGRPAFQGKSQASVMGSVLKDEPPPLGGANTGAPRSLDYLIRGCLAKDPDARFQSAHDVPLQLKWIAHGADQPEVATPSVSRRKGMATLWSTTALALVMVAVGIYWRSTLPANHPQLVTRFHHFLPEGETFARTGRHAVTISRDGARVAYGANEHLYLRSMDRIEAEPIRGTNEDPMEPVFSPDGAWLAYFAKGGGTLRKIPISGGAPMTLATLPGPPNGATWQDGKIIFAMNTPDASGIFAVPDTGGQTQRLLVVDPAVERFSQPRLLDDGQHVLFTLTSPTAVPAEGAIAVQSLRTGERTVLVRDGTGARVLETGHLVYVHDGSLFGVPFDRRRLALTAAPVRLAEGVVETGGGQFDISETGTLVYQAIPPRPLRTLVWVDRQGREEPIALAPADYLDPRISPDGTQLAVSMATDIWISQLVKPAFTRLTFTTTPKSRQPHLDTGRPPHHLRYTR